MNKIKDPLRKRYDCFLIWGHGLEFLNSIIEEIESSNNFRICHIEKKKINNIKKFIKKVYSFDYAPWEHLKNKTRYLYNQKKEVCFIFVENLNPDVEFVDVGNFRHSECMNVKKIKSSIRNKYNPQINNKITHNHIIHATDNEFQTYDMLELAAVNKDILKENEFLLPYFLNGYKSLNIKVIDTALLICSQIENGELVTKKIKDSIQYLFFEDKEKYDEYIMNNQGWALKSYYSKRKFTELKVNFKYLESSRLNKYILVKKTGDKFKILDGLHRASLCVSGGFNKLIVCICND